MRRFRSWAEPLKIPRPPSISMTRAALAIALTPITIWHRVYCQMASGTTGGCTRRPVFDGDSPPGYPSRIPGRQPTTKGAGMMKTHLLSVIALIAVLSPPAAASAPKELRVGIVTLLSGPASSTFGIPAKKAADAWVEKINDEGGIGGVKIVPVLTDEAGPGDKVVAEFRRLAADEKVDLVIGYISSANCVAVPAVAEELKVLTVLFDCGTTR